MRTPAGKECRYYYEDFHRSANLQECRLIKRNPDSQRWRPTDCTHCTVPDILWANASDSLQLRAAIKPGLLGLIGRRVEVEARCSRHQRSIANPYTGCDACNAERPRIEDVIQGIEEE